MFKLFKKKNINDLPKSDRYFKLKIKEVKKETEDTNTLVFEKTERPLNYKPGQFLTLILPIKGEEVRRSYSLCSSQFTDEFPAITVKRVEDGQVSNYLNDHMRAGDEFEVMEAAGHFIPDLKKEHDKYYILFAGGSGITPLMSILKSILSIESKSKITLVYQNRNENSIIFKRDLDNIKEKYTERFNQIDVLSQPTGQWDGYTGRIDTAMASDLLLDIVGNKINNVEYFICGPTGYMQTIIDTLLDFEVPEYQIHKESFYSGEPKKKVEEENHGNSSYDVTILLDGEEYNVNVPPEKTILEAALDQGLDMPFSCQSGLCTACRGKLLHGNVHMEDEDGLSEEEIFDGYILNCVSKPKGPDVKIEVG